MSDILLVHDIKKRVENLFIDLSFNKAIINNETVFEYKGSYHKLTFIQGLGGFVMKSAQSLKKTGMKMEIRQRMR